MSKFVSLDLDNPDRDFALCFDELLSIVVPKDHTSFFQRGLKGPIILESYSGDRVFLKEGDFQEPFQVATTKDGFLCLSTLQKQHWFYPLACEYEQYVLSGDCDQ